MFTSTTTNGFDPRNSIERREKGKGSLVPRPTPFFLFFGFRWNEARGKVGRRRLQHLSTFHNLNDAM